MSVNENFNLDISLENLFCEFGILNSDRDSDKNIYLTAPNMAAKVSRVVMAIVTLPGIDSGGKNKESQATMTNKPLGK